MNNPNCPLVGPLKKPHLSMGQRLLKLIITLLIMTVALVAAWLARDFYREFNGYQPVVGNDIEAFKQWMDSLMKDAADTSGAPRSSAQISEDVDKLKQAGDWATLIFSFLIVYSILHAIAKKIVDRSFGITPEQLAKQRWNTMANAVNGLAGPPPPLGPPPMMRPPMPMPPPPPPPPPKPKKVETSLHGTALHPDPFDAEDQL